MEHHCVRLIQCLAVVLSLFLSGCHDRDAVIAVWEYKKDVTSGPVREVQCPLCSQVVFYLSGKYANTYVVQSYVSMDSSSFLNQPRIYQVTGNWIAAGINKTMEKMTSLISSYEFRERDYLSDRLDVKRVYKPVEFMKIYEYKGMIRDMTTVHEGDGIIMRTDLIKDP